MKTTLQKNVLIVLGWFFVLLGAIGTILPVLPTTFTGDVNFYWRNIFAIDHSLKRKPSVFI